LLNDVSGKCRAVNFFWSAGITKISLLIKTREDQKYLPWLADSDWL
jgi:hypothetical protein